MSESKERYSFSKLSSFWTCPYGYYLKYVCGKAGIGNAFSSYGSFVHSLLERYAKGEIELLDLPSVYEWEFDVAVPESFPWNKYVVLRDTYYQQGLEFLRSFQGYSKYKILGVEQKFDHDMGDYIFNGVIDIILQDANGKLIIRDYKSKASFKNDAEKAEYARQLYLYSTYVRKTFGRFPDELQFLMFRKQKLEIITFNQVAYDAAHQWADNTVRNIRDTFVFPPKCEDFFANNLCNHREYCDMKGKVVDLA